MKRDIRSDRPLWLPALAALGLVSLVACVGQQAEDVSAQALYADFCEACHGASGRGDGPTASLLPKPPADLTTISARNGGTFPLEHVLSTIDGYSRRGEHSSIMPEMGPVLQEGSPVMVDTGDGIKTPVPPRLLALALYLETLQQ